MNLFSLDLKESDGYDNMAYLQANITGPSSVPVTWTSSNSAVASVSDSGQITAYKAGTAKITCTPQDGSKKSASVTVKVTNPVSYMEIKTSAPQMSNSDPYIGFGKTVTNTVFFGTTYGTPGNKSVTWDYTILQKNNNGTQYDMTSTFKNEKLVTIKSGKVTVSSKARQKWNDISGEFYLTLTATAKDGTGTSASKTFLLIPSCTKLTMIDGTKYKAGKQQAGVICFASNQWHSFRNEYQSGFTATSSNPKVCSVGQWQYSHDLSILPCEHYYYPDGSMNCYDLYIYTGTTKGKATITIKATDGSNKSCKFTVTVK